MSLKIKDTRKAVVTCYLRDFTFLLNGTSKTVQAGETVVLTAGDRIQTEAVNAFEVNGVDLAGGVLTSIDYYVKAGDFIMGVSTP